MAEDKLEILISAKTDEFIKSLKDIEKRSSLISKEMKEIDKQLKTESVDRVAKLSEKLELVKRSAALAEKEAAEYAKRIKEVTENHKEGEALTEKQQQKITELAGKMSLAQQKANTFAAEIDTLSKELKEAGNETEEVSKNITETGDSASDAAGKVSTFWQIVGGNLTSSVIQKGISVTIGLFKDLANAAWNAAKQIASAAKEYAKEAIDMAADYQDALGYSEQVFGDYAENVQKWVNDNSIRLRTNISDLQGYVNQMGSLYRSFGFEEQKAGELAQGLIDRAADLKAATGAELQDIIKSLTSVMTGGYQAGYKYGIVINEASVKAYALSNNLVTVAVNQDKVREASLKVEKAAKKAADTTTKYGENSLEAKEAQLELEKASEALNEALEGQALALTQAQKEEAIYRMILDQTQHMAGQSARESGNYKSQLDALKTTFDNLKISIGDKLLPVATDLITQANEFFQSEEGQAMLQQITDKVEKLANKVTEFITDGRLEEFITDVKEKLPGIAEDCGKLAKALGEVADFILKLTEPSEYDKLKALDEAVKKSKTEVHAFAQSVGVDMDSLRTAINGFAELNNVSVTDIYNDWATYQPQIAEYMASTGQISEEMKDKVTTATGTMASQAKTDLDATAEAFQDGLTKAGNADTSALQAKTQEVEGFSGRIKRALANFIDNSGLFQNAPGAEYAHRASGGPVLPGQVYRVNDDHGLRQEMFIPSVPGYILDGNRTQSVVNNNSSTSNSYGNINVYVNSYGADAASIADEIGQAVSQRLRMAGAW